jgi:Zn ribbon nucleic-acid-binding protein
MGALEKNIPDYDMVDEADACPTCHERDVDRLVWLADDTERVECQTCKTVYEPGEKGDGHENA